MRITGTTFDEILNRNWKVILASCGEHKIISKFKTAYFLTELKDLRRALNSRSKLLNKEFLTEYEFECKVYEVFLLENTLLLVVLDASFGLEVDTFKNMDPKSEQFANLRTATLLFHQLNNSIVTFLKLLSDGYNYQANIIFRNIIEQGTIIIAVLFDDNFRKELINNSVIEDKKSKIKHWRENLSPKKTDEILKKGYIKMGKSESHYKLIIEHKEIFYGETSNFVHSDYLANLFNSYTSKPNEIDEVDRNLFGRIDANIGVTFAKVLSYLHLLSFDIKQIIVKNYKIHFSDLDGGYSIATVSTLKDSLYAEYLNELKKIHK